MLICDQTAVLVVQTVEFFTQALAVAVGPPDRCHWKWVTAGAELPSVPDRLRQQIQPFRQKAADGHIMTR